MNPRHGGRAGPGWLFSDPWDGLPARLGRWASCLPGWPVPAKSRLEARAPKQPGWPFSDLIIPQILCAAAALLLAQPLTALDKEPLRLAIHDLATSHGERYPKAQEFLDRLERVANADELESLRREALLANPRLDFGPLMYVRRDATSPKLGLPQNWQGNCSLPRAGYRDSISVIEEPLKGGTQRVLFQPQKPLMIADVDLHFDGQRMLFSMIGSHNRWQIWEIRADGGGLRQVTAGDDPEVDNYDPCYLPDGKIIFYLPWQRVHNAGFRVAIKIPDTPAPTTAAK